MTEISMGVLEEIRKQLEDSDVDGLREMVRVLTEALMSAEVDAAKTTGDSAQRRRRRLPTEYRPDGRRGREKGKVLGEGSFAGAKGAFP